MDRNIKEDNAIFSQKLTGQAMPYLWHYIQQEAIQRAAVNAAAATQKTYNPDDIKRTPEYLEL